MSLHGDLALDPQLDQDIAAFASELGISFEEAHGAALRLGLQLGRAENISRDERLEGLERRVYELGEALHLLGPAAFGALRLLAHWATQTDSVQVGEDELLEELRRVSQDEWSSALAERGLIRPPDFETEP